MTPTRLIVAILLAGGGAASAQPAESPPIVNGRVETRAGTLAAVVGGLPAGASDVAWVAYAVAAPDRAVRCCAWDAGHASPCCGDCRLERGGDRAVRPPATATPVVPVPLEPSAGRAMVFVRVAGGAVDRIRVFSPSCRLDAGGRTVFWLAGVTADDSAAWLHGQAATANRRLSGDALMALAAHEAPAALDRLITSARSGATARLRGQALFWLARRAGERAVGTISEAIERDPDTDVKKRAVFALSQLPDGEGVPRLIDVARSHSNQAVRKQAFFWLGQSNDPRALAFFADVLKR